MTYPSRRSFLMTGVAITSAMRAMPSSPACVLTTEQEEGPYYVDYGKVRRDITEGKQGVPIQLRVALVHAKRCVPLANAAVDIWHCDAEGVYSGFTAGGPMGGPGGPGGPGGRPPGPPPGGPPPDGFRPPPRDHHALDATRFLRGIQRSDAGGMAEFATIYPGWYQGRAIHIHMKVHTANSQGAEHVSHTGQLFFPEEITSRIAKLRPYANHQDVHLTTHGEDDIFESQHGASGLVAMNRIDARSDAGGFIATITLAIDPEAAPVPVDRGPGEPPPTR